MSRVNVYLIAAAACACALLAVAAAAPRHDRHKKHAVHVKKRDSESFSSISLPEVLNKTVCPIQQVVDYDEQRVPRRIKQLKCAPTPHPVCRQEDDTRDAPCCGQKYATFNTECVEVLDNVVVSYLTDGAPHLRTISVAVGCTCMIRLTKPGSNE